MEQYQSYYLSFPLLFFYFFSNSSFHSSLSVTESRHLPKSKAINCPTLMLINSHHIEIMCLRICFVHPFGSNQNWKSLNDKWDFYSLETHFEKRKKIDGSFRKSRGTSEQLQARSVVKPWRGPGRINGSDSKVTLLAAFFSAQIEIELAPKCFVFSLIWRKN